jgi:hypothetical protein
MNAIRRLLGQVARKPIDKAARRIWDLAPGEDVVGASPRDYYLALSEYQRRTEKPLATPDLANHELRVSSQNGEDGIIQEILRRTGTSDHPYAVEFGVDAGSEASCVLLADLGWSALFIESGRAFASLERKYLHSPAVTTLNALVTPENVEALFTEAQVPADFDVLSIDIDGNDYWVWRALTAYRPRLVVIEYNSTLPADRSLVQPATTLAWDGTSAFGASIRALRDLGEAKSYRLVHTDLAAVNAFFVREDLPGDWLEPRIAGPNYALRSLAWPEGNEDFFIVPSS